MNAFARIESETFDEMVARHKRELIAKMREVEKQSFRCGISVAGGHSDTMNRVNAEVAMKHGVNPERMLSHRKDRPTATARFEAFKRLHDYGFSYSRIAEFYNRDHTTVMHGVKAHEARQSGVA